LFEEREVLIVFIIKTFFTDKFPEPFNQIEIGRISREKENFNIQTGSDL